MQITHAKIDEYCEQFTTPIDELLQKILAHTQANHTHAHMLSGLVQGKFLQMVSQMAKPLQVLEIGSFTGFSAICLAAGLQPNGNLHTIEIRENDAAIAKQFFDESDFKNNIILHVGNAIKIIPTLNIEWDLIFLDADKTGYIEYYELTLPKLKKGGFLLADNVLFHGQVIEENIKGKNAKAVHQFNKHVAADYRVEQVLLTVRDGITLIRKL